METEVNVHMIWDAVVIGAGISGCSVARELGRYDLKTLVLEKGSDLTPATTRGNSATVHAGYDPDPGTNKAIYNVRGNKMYPALCEALQVPFIKNGLIMIATDEDQLEECRRLKACGDANGVDCEVLSLEELRRHEPDLGDGIIGGLWVPDSGMVCPYNLAIAEAENAARNGVSFRLRTAVSSIRREDGCYVITTSSGEELRTRYVFNCAGTYADVLNNMVSADHFHITPREGQHLILDRDLAPYVHATIYRTPIALPGGGHTKGQGLMPSVDGTVILGCNADDVDDRDFNDTTRAGIDSIIDWFEENWSLLPISAHIPSFPRDAVITEYGGVRAHGDRDDFILGEPADAPNFINVAAIESPGVTAAPAIAVDMVRILAEREGLSQKPGWMEGRIIKKPFREMTEEERERAIAEDPDYARIVCRCEQITEAEIRDAIRRPIPATSINAIKMRTRAGMGRCQGGFCSPRVLEILAEELGLDPLEVTQSGSERSRVLVGRACQAEGGAV